MILGWLNYSDVLSFNVVNLMSTSWFNVLSFLGLWTIVWLPIAFFVSQWIDWQPQEPLLPKQKLILLASLYLIVPGIIVWRVRVESINFTDLGLSLTTSNLWYILWGLASSLISLILIFSLESVTNLVSWRRENLRQIPTLLLPILGLSLVISLVEELVFRGYILITLLEDNSFELAAIASSSIFAVLHLVWERKQTIPQLPGLWLMGIVLVAARVLTNNTIYFALGLHAGWIWGLTCIDSADLLIYKYPDHWFTGIKQQPLAGMAGILCLLITGLGIWILQPWLIRF